MKLFSSILILHSLFHLQFTVLAGSTFITPKQNISSSPIAIPSSGNPGENSLEEELKTGCNVNVEGHPNLYLLPNFTNCGNSYTGEPKDEDNKILTRRKRVTNGLFTRLGKFPWMCRIYFLKESTMLLYFHCGCSIINEKYVLTAAHCMTQNTVAGTPYSVAVGTVNRTSVRDCINFDPSSLTRECSYKENILIDEIIIHPEYSTSSYNDIALVRLVQPITFTNFVSPICLPRSEDYFRNWTNYKLSVAGWGQTGDEVDVNEDPVLPQNMRDLKLPLVPRKICDDHYTRIIRKLDGTKLCAGGLPAQGDCKGDSGGPLMKKMRIPPEDDPHDLKEHWVQFGIVSDGHCALEGVPGTYTNVLAYMPWILSSLEP